MVILGKWIMFFDGLKRKVKQVRWPEEVLIGAQI